MAEVTLEPDKTKEDVKIQPDGSLYVTTDLAGERVNAYVEVLDDEGD